MHIGSAAPNDASPAAGEPVTAAADTFPKMLLMHARQRPDRPAMREKDYGIWQSWSWAEVAAEIEALAGGLKALGFERGDKLAIIGDNRPRLYWAIASTQALGGTCVLMERFDAEEALRAIEIYGVTHTQWVPTMFKRLLSLPTATRDRYDLSTHRVALHGAALLGGALGSCGTMRGFRHFLHLGGRGGGVL